MSQDYIEYKLIDKKTNKEIKLDNLYYEPDTTALQIKIAILKYYGIVEEINPEIIQLRSRSYKSNSQDIGQSVELSTIFTDADSEKNEITFDINKKFQNASETLVAKHKIIKPQHFIIKGVEYDYVGDIKDRMPNGKGQIKYYTNELGETTVYEGEVKDGLPDGYGKMMFSKEQHSRIESYQGLFSEGHVISMQVDSLDNDDTIAYLIYRNGDQYEGGINGYLQPRGMGKMIKSNGDVYVGEFKFGLYNGVGKMTYADGTLYEGKWENGHRQQKKKLELKYDENTFLENITNNKRPNYNSPERKKSQLFDPPAINRKKKGGDITRKQKKIKTIRYIKKRHPTIKNKRPKSKRGTRKYK